MASTAPPISEGYRSELHRILDNAIDAFAGHVDVEVTHGTVSAPGKHGYMEMTHNGVVTIKIWPSSD